MRHGMGMTPSDSHPLLDPQKLQAAILDALTRAGEQKTLSATEIAHGAGGDNWHDLLHPIRRAAVTLALAGRLVIYRKGKPVDPEDFKGVYRLGLPRQD